MMRTRVSDGRDTSTSFALRTRNINSGRDELTLLSFWYIDQRFGSGQEELWGVIRGRFGG